MNPQRIQRKRTKGWKMPENTICVTRPGKWGNPFTGNGAVCRFEECLQYPHMAYYYSDELQATEVFNRFKWMNENLHLLTGRNLACFCSLDHSCHADVLLKYAND